MADSTYIFEEGSPIEVGAHGQTEYVFSEGTPVPNEGVSPLVFESGIGLGGGNAAYWNDQGANTHAVLDFDTFSIITSRSGVNNNDPDGIGGSTQRVWAVESVSFTDHFILEFDTSLNVQQSSALSLAGSLEGSAAGGQDDVVFLSALVVGSSGNDAFYEYTTGFSQVRSITGLERANGAGGDDTLVYEGGDGDRNEVTVRDYADLSVIRSTGADSNDIGGDEDTIIMNEDAGGNVIQERDPSDLSVVRQASSPTGGRAGAGGT